MDCKSFIERLDDFLGGRMTLHERRAAELHRDGCAGCREIETASVDVPDLTSSILERTSGSPCASSRERICPFVDLDLEPVDDALMRMHLESCADCAALAGAIRQLSVELPDLSELQPDDRFTRDVLRRSLPLAVRVRRRSERWSSGWRGLLRRPRFASEGAYLGTLLLGLLTAIPGSPLAAIPRSTLELARLNPVREIQQPLSRIERRVTPQVTSLLRSASDRLATTSQRTVRGATRYSSELVNDIKSDLGTLVDRLASKQETAGTVRSSDQDDRTDGDQS